MRVATAAFVVIAALFTTAAPAAADARAKALEPYAGKVIVSPDAPPREGDELPAYLKFNYSKDGTYELIKGPPWPFHVTAVLAAPAKQVTLVIADKADKKLTPLVSATFAPANNRKLLIAQASATVEAGFTANKTYVLRLLVGKKVVARAELLLRD